MASEDRMDQLREQMSQPKSVSKNNRPGALAKKYLGTSASVGSISKSIRVRLDHLEYIESQVLAIQNSGGRCSVGKILHDLLSEKIEEQIAKEVRSK